MSGIDAITTIRAQFPGGPYYRTDDLPRRCSTRAPQVGVHGYVLKGLLRGGSCWRRFARCNAEEERIPGGRCADHRRFRIPTVKSTWSGSSQPTTPKLTARTAKARPKSSSGKLRSDYSPLGESSAVVFMRKSRLAFTPA